MAPIVVTARRDMVRFVRRGICVVVRRQLELYGELSCQNGQRVRSRMDKVQSDAEKGIAAGTYCNDIRAAETHAKQLWPVICASAALSSLHSTTFHRVWSFAGFIDPVQISPATSCAAPSGAERRQSVCRQSPQPSWVSGRWCRLTPTFSLLVNRFQRHCQ